jgi:Holin of 3TMs, for gene-transfer release
MPLPLIAALIDPISKLLDKIIPDPNAQAQAKLQLLQVQGTQEMDELNAQLSAIIAEAKSTDPWTSRARPSFLYVIYIIILWCLPMGVIAAFRPETASAIANGMNSYLRGIPSELWGLFGTGYLGYTAARQWGKVKGVDK